MKVYDLKLTYTLVKESGDTALSSPDTIVRYMEGAFEEDPTVEWFFVIPLNRKNKPLGKFMVTKGINSASLVHPREVFKPAIVGAAATIVVVHNHPSGDPAPSPADFKATRGLREAGNILDIKLLDHIIIGDKEEDPLGFGYYSFQNAGMC